MPSGEQGTLIARVVAPGSPPADICWVDPGELQANGEFVPAPRIMAWEEAGHLEWASPESHRWFFASFVERDETPAPELPPSEARLTPLVTALVAVIAVLAAVAIMFVGVGLASRPERVSPERPAMSDTPLTTEDIAKVRDQVSRAFPGWTVEQVYGAETGAELAVELEWDGPEDFRTSEVVSLVQNVDIPGVTPILATSALQDPATAAGFIRAFKARHPERGIVTEARSIRDPRRLGQNLRGATFIIAYQSISAYRALDRRGLPSWDSAPTEQWHAADAGGKVVWELIGESR